MPGEMCLALMATAPPSYSLVGDSARICHSCHFKILPLTSMRPPLLKMLFILLLRLFTTYIRRIFLRFLPANLCSFKIPSHFYGNRLELWFLFGRINCLMSSVMLIDNLSVRDVYCDYVHHLKIDPLCLILLRLHFYLVDWLVFSLVLVPLL